MVSVAQASCPKCSAPRRDEPACPRCGIRADRMAAFASERDASVPDSVLAAWQRVEDAWDDAAAHDELFELTARHTCYAWTAARYRVAGAGKGEGTVDPHLERVRRAAEAILLSQATTRRETGRQPYRSAMLVLVLVVIMIVVGSLFSMVLRGRDPAPVQPAPQVR